MRAMYAGLVGILLGVMQTGLFFQLTFTLSSGFGTYLLVTVCWLMGSAAGVGLFSRWRQVTPARVLIAALCAYEGVALLLEFAPFDSGLWPVYGGLVFICGLYPGVFFARMAALMQVRSLFFWENNGFLGGLLSGTLLFILVGRGALWLSPVLLGLLILTVAHRATLPVVEKGAEP